jgi:muramoyltetrapeptide carboxypeptidase LdcA involved in peptidoglycan recycling
MTCSTNARAASHSCRSQHTNFTSPRKRMDYTGRADFTPVLGNLDFGHTDPLLTPPMGARALLDADAQVLRVPEGVTTP